MDKGHKQKEGWGFDKKQKNLGLLPHWLQWRSNWSNISMPVLGVIVHDYRHGEGEKNFLIATANPIIVRSNSNWRQSTCYTLLYTIY